MVPVSTTTKTGLTGGTTYEFKIIARNIFGSSIDSNTLTYIASQVPDKPVFVITSIQTVNVKLEWIDPVSNYAAIDKYQILIADHNAVSYLESTTLCDGSLSLTIADKYCIIPMTALRAAPFNLEKLEFITAKVRVHNSRGWSLLSDANIAGVTVATEPVQMSSPSSTTGSDERNLVV